MTAHINEFYRLKFACMDVLYPPFNVMPIPRVVGNFWCTGAILARCPSWRHQWLIWSPARMKPRFHCLMYVCMSFYNTVIEILTVCDSGWAQVDVLSQRGGWFHYWCDSGEYCTWGFCNLVVNSGMRIGPIRGLRYGMVY